MSTLDELPTQLESFLDRVRVALDQQIAGARKAVGNLNAEKTATAKVLADLKHQHELAEKQLSTVRADLQQALTRVGLDREIAAARKVLAMLQADIEKATAAKAAVEKQVAAGEARVVALGNEANRMIALRSESEAVMADIKNKLAQVQLGQRP
jgi:hypothetical protein